MITALSRSFMRDDEESARWSEFELLFLNYSAPRIVAALYCVYASKIILLPRGHGRVSLVARPRVLPLASLTELTRVCFFARARERPLAPPPPRRYILTLRASRISLGNRLFGNCD